MACSIWPASPRLMVLNFKSMGAKVWIAANCPIPEASVSRSTATRITRGAISLSSSSHFALIVYSNKEKPVALPPGCAKVATNPEPTGSTTLTKTIGTVRDACSSGATAGVVTAKMAAGVSATNSAAYLR